MDIKEVSVIHYFIRELRDMTGMTQKQFAEWFHIPISTLRKWEQGEARPADYIVELIARTIPAADNSLEKIEGIGETIFYYDRDRNMVYDQKGNGIRIQESLEGVKRENLKLYMRDLFQDLYEIQEKFNQDCRYDKEEDILWS